MECWFEVPLNEAQGFCWAWGFFWMPVPVCQYRQIPLFLLCPESFVGADSWVLDSQLSEYWFDLLVYTVTASISIPLRWSSVDKYRSCDSHLDTKVIMEVFGIELRICNYLRISGAVVGGFLWYPHNFWVFGYKPSHWGCGEQLGFQVGLSLGRSEKIGGDWVPKMGMGSVTVQAEIGGKNKYWCF